jgi:hypothetical protein
LALPRRALSQFAGAISEKRMPNSWSTWRMSVMLRQGQRNAIRRHWKGRTNMASVARVATWTTSTKCCGALQVWIFRGLQRAFPVDLCGVRT